MDAGLGLMLKFLLIAVAAGAVFVGKKYFGTKDDNVIEEMVEFEIRDKTGIDVDLTPDSPESGGVQKVSPTNDNKK
jgi:hypothetical protein